MIKLSEIRIGNIILQERVFFKYDDESTKVVRDQKPIVVDIHWLRFHLDEEIDSFSPISFEWYWLQKVKKLHNMQMIHCNTQNLNECGYFFTQGDINNWYKIGRKIESLHQFQNTFYELSGHQAIIEL